MDKDKEDSQDEDEEKEDVLEVVVMLHPSMSMCVSDYISYRRLGWAWGGQLTMLRA